MIRIVQNSFSFSYLLCWVYFSVTQVFWAEVITFHMHTTQTASGTVIMTVAVRLVLNQRVYYSGHTVLRVSLSSGEPLLYF